MTARTATLLFSALMLCLPTAVYPANSIAIIPFSTPDSYAGTDAGRWLAELTQRELITIRSLDIIEISEVRRLTRGKDVQLEGFLAGDDIRPVFDSVGADFLLTGRVVRFGSDARLDPIGQFWAGTWGDEILSGVSRVEIDLRLLERKSGKPISFFTVSKSFEGRKDILSDSAIREALRLSRTHQEDFRRSRIFQASEACSKQIGRHLENYLKHPLTVTEVIGSEDDIQVLIRLERLEDISPGQRYVAARTQSVEQLDLSDPTVIEVISQDLLTATGKVVAGNAPGRGDFLIPAESLPDTVTQADN